MADLLIKGMKMPKCCGDCPMLKDGYKSDWCYVSEADIHDLNALPKDCPLVEIPTHGRLIDANDLYEKTAEWESQALHLMRMCDDDEERRKWSTVLTERTAFKHDIADSTTVIEASEDGEQDGKL